MLLIKLGGSIITNKKRALSPRRAAIGRIARVLRRVPGPVALVHGGGSFGHYWSVRYGMHTKPAIYDARGVAVVKDSMASLNGMVTGALLKNGISPYVVPPDCLASGGRPAPRALAKVAEIAGAGLMPVTYGDAVWHGGKKSYILSGDRIMGMLARAMRPRLCVFVTDVDGVYSDPATKEVIPELGGRRPILGGAGMDVTGGMGRKIDEARRIAGAGLDVFFVNGNIPERILDAARGKKFTGTRVRGRRR